ncbi:MAG TPA: glycogen synthase GlgA [Candidatus Eisenbacteria bacterium]|nr:glycogen synthase GlgA [Candidatus Eisenbacteria bacterium]
MHVVHIASEAVPYAKTGGLGDVLGALPPALARAGVQTTVCLPGYRPALRVAGDTDVLGEVYAPVSTRTEPFQVLGLRGAPVPTVLLGSLAYFDREGLYGEDGRDYPDNAERFVAFCRAALEWMRTWSTPPDVLHVHDWQTALVPAFLRAGPELHPELGATRTVITIHNLAFQGRFPATDWHLLNLDRRWFAPDALEFYGGINFLKAGLVFSDAITTVSPRYAREIQGPDLGEGLDGLLRARAASLTGILNGADYGAWNPATDPALPARYDRTDLAGKARCRAALRAEMGLRADSTGPLLAVISRLAEQKGIDLVVRAGRELLERTPVQLVVLGSGEHRFEAGLATLRDRFPGRVALRVGFDDALAHRIEAGADVFLMPSRYEPCGLSQIYSLRYGTVPVVHATGGLDDTVEDFDPGRATGTGFKFSPFTDEAFVGAIGRAIEVWRDREKWTRLVDNGMRMDFSWERAAVGYRRVYDGLSPR